MGRIDGVTAAEYAQNLEANLSDLVCFGEHHPIRHTLTNVSFLPVDCLRVHDGFGLDAISRSTDSNPLRRILLRHGRPALCAGMISKRGSNSTMVEAALVPRHSDYDMLNPSITATLARVSDRRGLRYCEGRAGSKTRTGNLERIRSSRAMSGCPYHIAKAAHISGLSMSGDQNTTLEKRQILIARTEVRVLEPVESTALICSPNAVGLSRVR